MLRTLPDRKEVTKAKGSQDEVKEFCLERERKRKNETTSRSRSMFGSLLKIQPQVCAVIKRWKFLEDKHSTKICIYVYVCVIK